MARSGGNQKLRLLYLYEILYTRTDEQHPLSREQISDLLLSKYDIQIERKTFYDDIEYLHQFGADITKSGRGKYFLASRKFELPELHLLVDAIQSSHFITEKKSRTLIEKLSALCSDYEAGQIKNNVRLARRNKTVNEGVFYNIDAIYRAISEGKQLSFRYFNWQLSDGKLQRSYRRDGEAYTVSPFAVTWDDEKYYLIAFDADAKALRHYRVDKMENLSLVNKAREGQKLLEHFDSGAYTNSHFGMFGGETTKVTLRFDKKMLGVAIDRFGKDAFFRPDGEDHFLLIAEVTISPQFFGWLCSLEDAVELLEPTSAVAEFKDLICSLQKLYF